MWRNPEVRALAYQSLLIAGLVAAGYIIVQNTIANLRQRGISSGFGFLSNESGFAISEVVSFPVIEPGFLIFMTSVVVGLSATIILRIWLERTGRSVGDRLLWVVLALVFLIGLPAATLYWTVGHFEARTYQESSTYATALITGLLNTLKVSLIGCVLATILGLFVGIARLSSNWLVARLAEAFIEVMRNIPLLVQLFFWYFAVLQTLPSPRQSMELFGAVTLNNRGVYVPRPLVTDGTWPFISAVVVTIVAIVLWRWHSRKLQLETGRRRPILWPSIGALIVLPGLAFIVFGAPMTLEFPTLQGFNFQGGWSFSPEFTALLAGLTLYTAAFVAEIVRSGIQAISKGQREAARALGLREGLVMRLIILPQALRVIIPPLTSQYLNLTKNSSLGVAVGFPELVSVGGTILNQSGQAIEVIAITMAVYLTISLLISLGMNWYNARVSLVES